MLGGTSGDWISLAGMIIVPDESNAVPLDLLNGWSHYGSAYGQATYVLSQQAVQWKLSESSFSCHLKSRMKPISKILFGFI